MKHIITTLLFIWQFAYGQDLAAVMHKDRYGFIDRTGKMVIQPQYERARRFSEGVAAVFENGKWGFIKTTGEWAISPQFENARWFSDGLCLVNKGGAWMFINKKGEVVTMPPAEKYHDFSNGRALITVLSGKEKKVGIINVKGEFIMKPTYHVIKPFKDGYAKVRLNDRWGIIDATGKEVVEPIYESIGNYYKGTTWAKLGKEFGLVINGKFTSIAGVLDIWDFNEDVAYARKGEKVGFLDVKGNWVIEPKFDKARAFVKGLAPVNVGGKWGYIDKSGKLVISPAYNDAEVFSEDGLAPVKDKDWGFINQQGKLVIPTNYEITAFMQYKGRGFNNGVSRVKYKGRWGFINTSGEPIGGSWYEKAELFGTGDEGEEE